MADSLRDLARFVHVSGSVTSTRLSLGSGKQLGSSEIPVDASLILDHLRRYHDGLSIAQAHQISTYIDILLRWNAKMNLTAIRNPEQIVKRHFGESLFLARHLSQLGLVRSGGSVFDVGSGAGFPGIPLKIACPEICLTLVEAHGRKAVFLKEVLRALNLDAEVKNVRAEELARSCPSCADVVTLRAVERFEVILPTVAKLANPSGSLALLIGKEQLIGARNLLESWKFASFVPILGSEIRGIAIANQDG